MTIVKLAVTEFAQRSIPIGDIDERSVSSQVAVELGIQIHHKIQKKRAHEFASYQCEGAVTHTFSVDDQLDFEVSGRLDGLWETEDGFVLEEIKSTFNIKRLLQQIANDPEHPYLLQIKTYAWILAKTQDITPKPHLLIVSAGSGIEHELSVPFDLDEMDRWIESRLEWLQDTWNDMQATRKAQKLRGKSLKFPFAKRRPGQQELLDDVTRICDQERQLLAQAPTGLGKTAAVIVPSLKKALSHGDKLFHITPKNSQLREAEKVLQKLHAKGSDVRGMIVTAKAKICMQVEAGAEPRCNPELCRFAQGHYDKVHANNLIKKLRDEPVIEQKILRQFAETFEVCPYELGRQLMPWMDLIAGDYHYALSPHASFTEVAVLPLQQNAKPLLTIDEAHNLAERAIDWFSGRVEKIPEEIILIAPKAMQKPMRQINYWLTEQLQQNKGAPAILKTLDRDGLQVAVGHWTTTMPKLLESLTEPPSTHPIVSRWYQWLQFAELATLPAELFFAMTDAGSNAIDLHCANAGPLIRPKMTAYASTVAFSATLKPFQYHVRMGGFDDLRVETKEYQTPFPAENRRIIAIPQISTTWRDRGKHLSRIAEVIERVIKLRPGNYVAFFPSFELLRQTLPLVCADGFEVIEQPAHASQHWTRNTLKSLKNKRNVLLFAVQGGILSEGIDLPGEQLIGAFIVGPALPMVTREREERRKLLHEMYGDGFAMAYIHPAMAKSIQSAGRVVRTPKDKGVIVLMDPRFLDPQYASAFPSDWLDANKTPHQLVSTAILSDLKTFWESTNESL